LHKAIRQGNTNDVIKQTDNNRDEHARQVINFNTVLPLTT